MTATTSFNYDSSEGLATLEQPHGKAPETRMENAMDASLRIQTLMNAEKRGRAQRRALVKGLVDGNPPYKPGDLRKAGRAQACNVNWRVAEYYLNMARFAFYDVFSEVPTFCTIKTDFGSSAGQRDEWSGIITEEFDDLLRTDPSWDRVNQFSILDMVLYGCGPLVFNDETDWRNEFVTCGGVLVPDFASSDPQRWEEWAIVRNYRPDELYGYIRNEKAARKNGWDVEATKKAIMMAHPKWGEGGQFQVWEWHQQRLKNNSFYYGSECKVIQTAHYYFKEFPEAGQDFGRITHCIVINPEDSQAEQGKCFLFRKLRRFGNVNEIIHPMYYDNDGGGYHHSVTGLGQKMYSAMEYQNRLICNVADKAFAPKILFRPIGANNDQQLSIAQFAEYGKLPAGFDVVQTPVQSFMEEGVAFNRELTGLIASNLAQYRTALTEKSGNPITAYEAQLRASEQSKLGKTQLNHYYNQLDWLFAEKYRRACNTGLNGFMPGGREAVKFRNACLARGVPIQAIRKVLAVKSTRTVGQGSPFMRQQALQQLLAISPMIPNEGGRMNLVTDYIASVAGQSMVNRYAPKDGSPELVDQLAMATLQIGAAKDGIQPVVGGSQNHYVYARAFIEAMAQAIQSVQQAQKQGPEAFMQTAAGVIQFMDTLGPATAKHLEAMRNDPSRQQELKTLDSQFKQIAGLKDKLVAEVQKVQQQMQRQQQQNKKRQKQIVDSEQLDRIELQSKIGMQQQKTDAMIEMKREKQNQSLAQNAESHMQSTALSDAQVASDIQRKNVTAVADENRKASKADTNGD